MKKLILWLRISIARMSIRNKIIVSCMTVGLSSILLFSISFIINDSMATREVMEQRLSAQANIIAANAGAALVFNDQEAAEELLVTLQADSNMLAAGLYQEDGQRFADFAKTKNDLKYLPELLTGMEPHDDSHDHSVFNHAPVMQDGELFGHIVLVSDDSDLTRRFYYILILSLIICWVISLFSVLQANWLQRTISNPIIALKNLSHDVEQKGNYSLRAKIAHDDELGSLAQSLNRMLSQIEQRDYILEQKVKQRTLELERLNEKLKYQALYDSLTGLPNRDYFTEYFKRATQAIADTNQQVAVLFLDLDNFKNINDTLGHDIGDQLLSIVAKRLRSCTRQQDIVSRFGGDEFTILLSRVNHKNDVGVVANNLVQSIAKPIFLANQRLNITVSVGASLYPDDGKDLISLKRYSDVAMYNAKNSGKNTFKFFSSEMEGLSHKRLLIQNELSEAIQGGQLELFYQPKFDARLNCIAGLEALVRWRHPKYGLITPDEFIPYAEETGQGLSIDLWVLRESSRQQQQWWQEYNEKIAIAVNISAQHLKSDHILDTVNNVFNDAKPFKLLLELELTEASFIDQTQAVLHRLKKLKNIGLSLSLDDFGTGYSSLSYLREFPIDTVKIDQSFVRSVPEDQQATRLIKAIIAMARSLQLNVLAEGVEREQQKQFLLDNGCYLMQGFLFSKPLTANECNKLLSGESQKFIPALV